MTRAARASLSVARLDDAQFAAIAELLHDMTGIFLKPTKHSMVSARLNRRLKDLGLPDFAAYCDLLGSAAGAEERIELVELMTTNTTRFNREAHHFDHFDRVVLPGLIARLRDGGRVRIWSAGCSSGEEAYGLAFRVLDQCPEAHRLDLRILASDIDRMILQSACDGLYEQPLLEPLSPQHVSKYFAVAPDGSGRMRVTDRPRDLIAFRLLNLQSDWPFSRRFDVIMCRNVMIYFDPATQARLWSRFAEVLAPDGWLYIGHSESIAPEVAAAFSPHGTGAFQSTGRTDRSPVPRTVAPIPLTGDRA